MENGHDLGEALILTPFATHPLDAGQRKRAYQTTMLIKDLGFRITLIHYAFETRWYWGHNQEDDAAMRLQWGNDIIHFYANKKVGLPPVNGQMHHLDEWWDEGLGGLLTNVFSKRSYDIFVVHNIWLSKAFDFAPYDTCKVLEMHDLFSQRAKEFRDTGVEPEFFYCSEEDELFGLNRSDLAWSIKAEDERWCREKGIVPGKLVTIPYAEPSNVHEIDELISKRLSPLANGKVTFGVIGSDIHFNRYAVAELIRQLELAIRRTYAPVELLLAGSICRSLGDCPPFVKKLGFVDRLEDFYSSLDVVIVPMTHGTGVKIKSVEAVSFCKPILFTAHSAEGTGYTGQVFANLAELANCAAEIALASEIPQTLLEATLKAQSSIHQQLVDSKSQFKAIYLKKRPEFLHVVGPSSHDKHDLVIDAALGILLFKQLASWFRPSGISVHPLLSPFFPSVPAAPLPFVGNSELLMSKAATAQFVFVSAYERDLICELLKRCGEACLILDCRRLSVLEMEDDLRAYMAQSSAIRLMVSPWQAPFVPADFLSSLLVFPCLNERFSWDPHAAFVRDTFQESLSFQHLDDQAALLTELRQLGMCSDESSSHYAYNMKMCIVEAKQSLLGMLRFKP